MDYEGLHTSTLEKLYGPIKGQIIKQDKHFRIIHLRDKKGISRTLGVVKFIEIVGEPLKVAHHKILDGALLGKTLFDSHIDFDKEIIGALEVKFTDGLKNEFKCLQNNGMVFFSRIMVKDHLISKTPSMYSELIEVMPYKLGKLILGQTKHLTSLDDNLLNLCEAADLTPI
ncbi:MAG: hypothetical protein KAJ23_03710 [Maribacter sp.]|nr:hypothetical protein [Maribacter sp.]